MAVQEGHCGSLLNQLPLSRTTIQQVNLMCVHNKEVDKAIYRRCAWNCLLTNTIWKAERCKESHFVFLQILQERQLRVWNTALKRNWLPDFWETLLPLVAIWPTDWYLKVIFMQGLTSGPVKRLLTDFHHSDLSYCDKFSFICSIQVLIFHHDW